MSNRLSFNKGYFILALLLLLVEILIAVFVHDKFIRPHVGDFLVVILLYCMVKAFVNASPLQVALPVLVFSFLIEILQYFHAVDRLGLRESRVASTVMGTSFEWTDIWMYIAGVAVVLIVEKWKGNSN